MVFLKVETKFTPQIITPILQADPFGQFEKISWKSDGRGHCSIFFNVIFLTTANTNDIDWRTKNRPFEKSDFEFPYQSILIAHFNSMQQFPNFDEGNTFDKTLIEKDSAIWNL